MNSFMYVYTGLKSRAMKSSTYSRIYQTIKISKLYSTDSADKIKIPNRIQRGPTDILQALSTTISRDPTAPHYKYHDDPYLIPMSNIGKRTFAMAQEAGRKAAMFVRQEQSHLFNHSVADPPIEAFIPKATYNEKSDVSEDVLTSLIHSARVTDAIIVYNLLTPDKVSPSTKQALLELLCFYNHEEPIDVELLEERWFRQGMRGGRDRQRNTWKSNELADTIFHSLENKDSAAYCAMISGMAKYCQVERAWGLYQETLAKNILLDTETYNYLIRSVNFLREGNDLRWQLILELLTAMRKQQLKPTVGTLNAVLESIGTMGGSRQPREYALQTLAEFKQCGVEPSLASWYYILNTFCRERGPTSSILIDILDYIEKRPLQLVDLKDIFFFVTAMDVCRNHLRDKDVAYRLDRLLHQGENYNLLGDSYKESIYYRHFFMILITNEPLEVFMEYYFKIVPHVYIPEPSVMEEILQAVGENGAVELIPMMWSHMVIFDHTGREALMSLILKIMVDNKITETKDQSLVGKFSDIAWHVWEKIEGQPEQRTQRVSWSGQMLGDIMILLLRAGTFDNATKVLQKLNEGMGVATVEPLEMYLEQCIANKVPSKAIECIQYCAENAFSEVGAMARKLATEMTLDETQTGKLINIVGKDALK